MSSTLPATPTDQIYLVEDNAELRASLHWLLEGAGFHVLSFSSAEEFLQMGDTRGCLILDLRLPGMDGIELLSRLQGRPLRVIMMSAHGDNHAAERARRAGAWKFLEKPVDHGVLINEIRLALA